jgi:predicted RNA-binding protein associated with RNAse of E/G family
VYEDGEVSVTFARDLRLSSPVCVEGEVVLEEGSDAVWFTFPGTWHDIGRFHRADGTFTGTYANILTPCTFEAGGIWRTTDLFLDLWIPATEGTGDQGRQKILLLDEAELRDAEERGWVNAETARTARAEARRLMAAYDRGEWPPRIVSEWTRERCLDQRLDEPG